MSVLSRPRTLRRTPVVPAPRPAGHDGGIPAPDRRPTDDRTSRRRRAALVLAALAAAVAAGVATAVVQLSDDDPVQPAPTGQLQGPAEVDSIREEMQLRTTLEADAERAADAQRAAVESAP